LHGLRDPRSYHRLTADVSPRFAARSPDLRQAQEAAARGVARTATEARALEGRITEVSGAQAVSASELTTLRERVETAEPGCARRARRPSPPRRRR